MVKSYFSLVILNDFQSIGTCKIGIFEKTGVLVK